MSAPSPTPSNMPPPNLKRPRQSAAAGGAGAGSSTAGATGPRTKRRKPEAGENAEKRYPAGIEGMKMREEEWAAGEGGDVRTKIDFNDLPVETLYKYLEFHDLLPRWDVSPWSEDPCTPPSQLYTLPPPPPPHQIPLYQPTQSQEPEAQRNDSTDLADRVDAPTVESSQAVPATDGADQENIFPDSQISGSSGNVTTVHPDPAAVTANLDNTTSNASLDPSDITTQQSQVNGKPDGEAEAEVEPEPEVEPPTTRSKTAPSRKPPTPSPTPTPAPAQTGIKRGVITLSDVYAAREVLAEKANAHWMKGLGGGQNKEGETIVNFLYKMKVGHGRLLRVYNPAPAPYPGW